MKRANGHSRPATAVFVAAVVAAVACGTIPPSTLPTAPSATSILPTSPGEPSAGTAAPAGLASQGPFVLFAGQNIGVWLANPDGSFPTQLSAQWHFGFDLHHALSPGGDRLALVTRNETGLDLVEITLPDGATRTLAHLIRITPDQLTLDPTSEKSIAAMMIGEYDTIAWQPPDGQRIAYAGAEGGPTSDIYIVDTTTGEIRQLTDGPSQAIFPSWSPDGRHIYHVGVSLVPPFGGAIVGFNRIDGSWAVRVSDGEIISQPPLVHPSDFLGWLDESHYLALDWTEELSEVDVGNGDARAPLMAFCPIADAVRSGDNGTLLLSVLPETKCSSGVGVYLWDPKAANEPALLDPERSWGLQWLKESAVFDVYPMALFSPDGSIRRDPPVRDSSYHPALSKRGFEAWEVIENTQGRVVVRVAGGEWREILQTDVAQLMWDPVSGETLLIAAQDGRLYAASAPDFVPRIVADLGGSVDQAIWVP